MFDLNNSLNTGTPVLIINGISLNNVLFYKTEILFYAFRCCLNPICIYLVMKTIMNIVYRNRIVSNLIFVMAINSLSRI